MDELKTIDLETKRERKMSTTGKVLLGVTGCVATGICAVTLPFVSPALRKVCLPYVPATNRQVDNVMRLLKGKSGSVVDLGSGDGRIVIETARHGFCATGLELNPWLVWFSRFSALKHGVRANTSFHRKDIWKADLAKYDNVVIFGVEQMMEQLQEKLNSELHMGGHVIACRFPLPSWQPIETIEAGIDTVWLYSKNNQIKNKNVTPKEMAS